MNVDVDPLDEKEKLSGGPAERASILWHSYLTGDRSRLDAPTRAVRHLFQRLPSAKRCRVCNAPFEGRRRSHGYSLRGRRRLKPERE